MIKLIVSLYRSINAMSWKSFLVMLAVLLFIVTYTIEPVVTFVLTHTPYFYTMVKESAMDTKERDRILDLMYKCKIRSKLDT